MIRRGLLAFLSAAVFFMPISAGAVQDRFPPHGACVRGLQSGGGAGRWSVIELLSADGGIVTTSFVTATAGYFVRLTATSMIDETLVVIPVEFPNIESVFQRGYSTEGEVANGEFLLIGTNTWFDGKGFQGMYVPPGSYISIIRRSEGLAANATICFTEFHED